MDTIIAVLGATVETWNVSVHIHIMDTIIAVLGATVETWNVSVYIHIMDTIIAVLGATIETWNVSVHIHIMDTNATEPFEINHRKLRVELLISEITGSVLHYPALHKKCHAYFYDFPPMF